MEQCISSKSWSSGMSLLWSISRLVLGLTSSTQLKVGLLLADSQEVT